MKASLTFDLSNIEELQEYNNIIAYKDLIKTMQTIYLDTEDIINNPNSLNISWILKVNETLYSTLSNFNLDINKI